MISNDEIDAIAHYVLARNIATHARGWQSFEHFWINSRPIAEQQLIERFKEAYEAAVEAQNKQAAAEGLTSPAANL